MSNPLDNADIILYEDGLIMPFNFYITKNSKFQIITPTRDSTQEKESADGEIDFGTWLDSGEIVINGIIEYSTFAEKQARKRELGGLLDWCRQRRVFALEIYPDIGKGMRFKAPMEAEEHATWMEINIAFTTDPFWESLEEKSLVGSGTITNNGTQNTPIVVEIAGPVTDPVVVVGDYSLQYTGSIGSDEKLVINTEHKTVKLDSTNKIDSYNGVYPEIESGDTSITAAANGTTTIKWHDRYA